MTNKEAIERLEDEKRCVLGACNDECKYWKNHECHSGSWQHTQFDAINASIEALEKQIPKKPKDIVWDYGAIREFKCPTCEAEYIASGIKGLSKGKYCEECGQMLDWEGENV